MGDMGERAELVHEAGVGRARGSDHDRQVSAPARLAECPLQGRAGEAAVRPSRHHQRLETEQRSELSTDAWAVSATAASRRPPATSRATAIAERLPFEPPKVKHPPDRRACPPVGG